MDNLNVAVIEGETLGSNQFYYVDFKGVNVGQLLASMPGLRPIKETYFPTETVDLKKTVLLDAFKAAGLNAESIGGAVEVELDPEMERNDLFAAAEIVYNIIYTK